MSWENYYLGHIKYKNSKQQHALSYFFYCISGNIFLKCYTYKDQTSLCPVSVMVSFALVEIYISIYSW